MDIKPDLPQVQSKKTKTNCKNEITKLRAPTPAVERVAAGGVAGWERVATGAFVRAVLIATRDVGVSKATNVASGIKNACPDKGARIVFLAAHSCKAQLRCQVATRGA